MAQASKVSGIVQIDGTPVERTVRAFGYEAQTHAIDGNEVTLSRTLGHATSDPATGEYTIDLLAGYAAPIFVVAFDDYGADFTPDMALAVGDRVHPTTPNGHVWECVGAGTLPSEEPAWIIDTETAQLYGTASMLARPFYRPMVHGPVAPEIVEGSAPAPTLGLIALYTMDSVSGITLKDDHGNHDGTLINSPGFGPAVIGNGIALTRGDNVEISPALPTGGVFSVCFFALVGEYVTGGDWFINSRSATSGFQQNWQIVRWQDPDKGFQGIEVVLWLTNGQSVYIQTNRDLPIGVFAHVALTVSSTHAKIYLDGELISSTPITAPVQTGATKTVIGASGWNNRSSSNIQGMDGIIDQLRIYNVALTQEEVLACKAEGQ